MRFVAREHELEDTARHHRSFIFLRLSPCSARDTNERRRPRPLRPAARAFPRSPHSPSRARSRSTLAPRAFESTHMFATRVSSFSVGFTIAAAGGLYVIRQDIQKHFQDLRREQTALSDRVRALERAK